MPDLKIPLEAADHLMSMIPGFAGMPHPTNAPPGPPDLLPGAKSPGGPMLGNDAPEAPAGGPLGAIPSISDAASPAKPQRSVAGKVGHVLGEIGGYGLSALVPHVAAMIPQTPLGRIAEQGREQQQQNLQSEEDLRKAQAEAETTKAGAEKEKADAAQNRTPVTDKQGNTYYLDQAGLDKYAAGEASNQTKSDIADSGNKTKQNIESSKENSQWNLEQSKETAAQLLQAGRPVTMDQLAARATRDGDQATLDKVQQFKEQIAKAGKQEPGNFIPVNDAQGNTTGFVNPKARDFVPISGIAGVGEAASGAGGTVIPPKPNPAVAAGNKSAQESLAFAEDYGKNGTSKGPDGKPIYTGAGDEALMEQYFNLAKPSSGFRMNQSQMDMLVRSRAWMQSAEGIAYHAKEGVWFPPDQRNQIIGTMEQLGRSKGVGKENAKPGGAGSQVIKLTRGIDGKLKAQ